ncbi:hypothetical protein I2492_16815 [Budviciaceae bacterium CWB-B4]|uniref:Uncharacterized protein n=1 Tax=Limnobaculum xujianqingii TaxID=2738837 RepID=A0A9D7FZB1_9GAMM|nr:hypothetical protein [Limnobaculum xujianqingii]MBK5074688.1 hypothetical protein [Limnobaculum xujianqingii]MBK5177980.1 hypothetical protein [Limnobaculum xujianqingii]
MSSSVHVIRARSEDIAEYRRSMACLNALMKQWEAVNQQYSEVDALKIEQIRQRFEEMKQYQKDIRRYSAEAFAHLTEQIPGMIEFVRQDIEQMQEALIEQHTVQRQHQRAQQENAAMLLNLLQQRMPEQQTLLQQLDEVTKGEQTSSAEKILSQAILMIGQQPARLTEAQQALAQRLKEPMPEEQQAITQQGDHHSSQSLQRIDRHIAELTVLDPQQDIALFMQRAAELDRLTQDSNWNMLKDSLILDLAQATRHARIVTEKRQQLGLLLAGLESYHSPAISALIERLNLVLTSRELQPLIEAIAVAQAATEQQQQNIAALARREAVLDGLAKLGYEVRESDAEAWLDDGKVVIRKPATPGYGLELAGAKGSERFQVRAVAFSEQRDTQRDADIESIWCGEHQQLQQILAETGDRLTVERALAAGESPLKVARPADVPAEQVDYRYRGEGSRSLD